MKLIQRIGYYLGGFSIGLILLAFFLRGKNTSCDYGPNARTIKNISIKKRLLSDETKAIMNTHDIDTTTITNLILTGDVNFQESDTKSEGCKTYVIENKLNKSDIALHIKNCDSVATVLSIDFK
jgi:hypothetical protein